MLLIIALLNFVIVAVTGLAMRGVHAFGVNYFSYTEFLHGHSHFAFGGWLTPLLIWIIMRYFPVVRFQIDYRRWRNIIILIFGSAYGMLFSFPMQGYGPVSLVFSTISLLSPIYLAIVILRALRNSFAVPDLLLKAAFIFLIISAAGPLATGPLAALGYKGTPAYYNAVYFYLHFQLNGFFQFVVLAALCQIMRQGQVRIYDLPAVAFVTCGCVCSVMLSFLWNHPGSIYNILGGSGALVHFIGMVLLLRHSTNGKMKDKFLVFLRTFICGAILLKSGLQVLSAMQPVADFIFLHRELTVAYLHLVTLGIITLFGMLAIYLTYYCIRNLRVFIIGLMTTIVFTELALIARATALPGKGYFTTSPVLLFWLSVPFPVAALLIFIAIARYQAQSQNRFVCSLSPESHQPAVVSLWNLRV